MCVCGCVNVCVLRVVLVCCAVMCWWDIFSYAMHVIVKWVGASVVVMVCALFGNEHAVEGDNACGGWALSGVFLNRYEVEDAVCQEWLRLARCCRCSRDMRMMAMSY